MRNSYRLVSVVLILTTLFCLTGCSTRKLSHAKIVEYLDKETKYDECDDIDEFSKIYGRPVKGNEGYISLKDKKAGKLYEKIFNKIFAYPDYDIVEATCAYGGDSDGANALYMFTLNDEKEAEKLFKKVKKAFKDNGDSDDGEEKGITYLCTYHASGKRNIIRNVYLEKDTVLVVMCATSDTDFVEELLEHFKLPYIIDEVDD